MEQQGLWDMFFKTGLPEVYLAIVGQRTEEQKEQEQPAQTAFQPRETEI